MDAPLRDGDVETYAGTGEAGFQNGERLAATFCSFWSCCVAPFDGIYIGDLSNDVIRLVDARGLVSTYAGTGNAGTLDGPRLSAQLHGPAGLCVTSTGELLISEKNSNLIRKVTELEMVITVAGSGKQGHNDGVADKAMFNTPIGICESPMGILVADWFNHSIRLISNGMVTTFAGAGKEGFENGERLAARFSQPVGVVFDPKTGQIFVSDRNNHCIRVIYPHGTVATFAGNRERGFQDGPALDAQFASPWAVCMSPLGDVVVADEYNNRIRAIDPVGNVSTIAGDGEKAMKDGPRQTAQFAFPACVSLSSNGDVFVADRSNQRLRRIRLDRWMTDTIAKCRRLSLSGLREAEFLADLSLELKPSVHWKLHSPVLSMRCPTLLREPEVLNQIQCSNFSADVINGLISFLYDSSLPKLSVFQLCDLNVRVLNDLLPSHLCAPVPLFPILTVLCLLCFLFISDSKLLANVVRLEELEVYVRREVRKALVKMPGDQLLSILKYIVLNSGSSSRLVDLVIQLLRLHRAQIEQQIGTLSEGLAPGDPRFLDGVGKLTADLPLTHNNEDYASNGTDLYARLQQDLTTLLAMTDPSTISSSSSPSAPSSSDNAREQWRQPDFVLRVDNFEMRCHKWLLCGRWSYVRDALAFGGSEADNSIMEFPSDAFTPTVLRLFVKYLYTSEVSDLNNEEDCLTILKLAGQFRLLDSSRKPVPEFGVLIDHCRAFIVRPLSLDNCIAIYKLVLEYGSPDQQASVRSFIVHRVEEMTSNPQRCREFESLGTTELVSLLVALSRAKKQSNGATSFSF